MSDSSGQSGQRAGKKMRKGTHSCVECRRRKLRCVFPANGVTCFSCAARRSRCVGQSSRRGVAVDASTPGARHILPKDGAQAHKSTSTSRDEADSLPDAGTSRLHDLPNETHLQAPLASLFRDANLSTPVSSAGRWPPSKPVAEQGREARPLRSRPRQPAAGPVPTCANLRSKLPSYDEILSIISQNGSWWPSFRQKARALTESPPESLEDFAQRAYTSSDPAELSALAVAVARSSNRHHNLYSLVEDGILADPNFMATINGVECATLLAKSYTDEGQPNRAWVTWRKALTASQLMGLARGDDCSPTEYRLWMTIYYGDRFCSLLLGLPYGMNDNHYKSVFETLSASMSPAPLFVLRCARISGSLSDRNLNHGKPSLAEAAELDRQLDAAASALPDHWWIIPAEVPHDDAERDVLREQLLQQFYFFFLKLYLYLPFMVSSSDEPSPSFSRETCMKSARQILKRYQLLRSRDAMGSSLFECKTTDLACFTAAVILLVGISHCNGDSRSQGSSSHDVALITSVDQILQTEEEHTGSKIASQCRKTLRLLRHGHGGSNGGWDGDEEIVIPFFGIVMRKPVDPAAQPIDSAMVDDPPTSEFSTMLTPSDMADGFWDSEFFRLEYVQSAQPYGYGVFGQDDEMLSWFGNAGLEGGFF